MKPEFFDDPQVGALSTAAALFFIGLWTQADKAGRLEYDPKRLKLRLLGFRRESAEVMVNELAASGFVCAYAVGEHKYLQIKNFKKHQRPHPKEAGSAIPAPPCNSTAESGNAGASKLDTGVLDTGVLDTGVLDTGVLDTGVLESGGKATLPRRAARLSSDGFAAFWSVYPRKIGKGAAKAEWAKLQPSADLQVQMLAALDRQRTCDQWKKDGGQFIPHLRTWLRQQRWEDEIDALGHPSASWYLSCSHDPRCEKLEHHRLRVSQEADVAKGISA